MSVDTKIIITCSRCGEKSTPDNYKEFCSKVNLPSPEHFHSFETVIGRNVNKAGISYFNINIKIDERVDLCPGCRKWVDIFFNDQADKIANKLEQR